VIYSRYSAIGAIGAVLLLLLSWSPVRANGDDPGGAGPTVEGPADKRAMTEALLTSAAIALANDPATSLSKARNALELSKRLGDAALEHRALRSCALAERRMGMYVDHLHTTMQALEVAQVIADPLIIALDLQDLSKANAYIQQMDKAVEEARNALAMVLPTQDEEAIAQAMLFLMETMERAGRHEEVLSIGWSAIQRTEDRSDDLLRARIWLVSARALLHLGKHNDAIPLLTKAERIIHGEGVPIDRAQVFMVRAGVLQSMGQLKDARDMLDEAAHLLNDAEAWEATSDLMELQYRLALASRDHGLALDLLQRIRAREDLIQKEQMAMKMAGLQVLFDVERKDRDNAALRDMNASHAETIKGQRASNRYLAIALAVVFALAAGLFLAVRHSLRMTSRLRIKNAVVRQQHDEIHAKNLELQRQNMRLAESLMSEEEKDMMLKEIHHRVKNNLQVVDSLLNIQGGQHDDPAVKKLFREAQGRIRSMALVHEHIYKGASNAGCGLRDHLEKLCRGVLVSYGVHDRISVSVEAVEPGFDAETLIPLTLLVNELLTNAVKYAFEGRDTGHVNVMLRAAGDSYELVFSDDGIGMGNDHFLPERSFGLELIHVLAKQLNGEIRMLNESGTCFSLVIEPERKPLRLAS
jgi:two-component sensor histidine kinase